MTPVRRFVRRLLCRFGFHDKRTGAWIQIRDGVWFVDYEHWCRHCRADLGTCKAIYRG